MMVRYKNILVGVDGSSTSYHALAEAIRLAQWSRGRIAALTVLPSYEGDLNLIGVKDIQSVIGGSSATISAKIFEVSAGMHVDIDVFSSIGKPHEAIGRCVVDGNFDLIVLGCSVSRGFRAWFGSSTASALVRENAADLLLIKNYLGISWEQVLLVDYSRNDGTRHLLRAAELTSAYGGNLRVLRVGRDTDSAADPLPGALQKNIEYAYSLRDDPNEIAACAAGGRCGLIILGKSHRSRFHLTRTLYLKRIWHPVLCPVMILKSD